MIRLLAVFGGFVTAASLACPALGQAIEVGALPPGSPVHGITNALAHVVGGNSRLTLHPVAFDRSSAALSQLGEGKITMVVASAISANRAVRRSAMSDNKPLANLRVLARLLSFRAGFVVRSQSDIRRISDFKGRSFPSGATEQGILGTLARAAFATEGMDWKDVNGMPVTSLAQSADELIAGRVEGAFLAPTSRLAREANAAVKLRFLSISQTPETTAIVRKIAPGAFFSVVKSGRQLPYIERPTTFLGVDYLILIGADTQPDIAYETAKTLYLKRRELIARHPLFRTFNTRSMGKKGIGPAYHPGAIKFYKEAGLW
jgi:TRAP transporter TAXI family solute receptor